VHVDLERCRPALRISPHRAACGTPGVLSASRDPVLSMVSVFMRPEPRVICHDCCFARPGSSLAGHVHDVRWRVSSIGEPFVDLRMFRAVDGVRCRSGRYLLSFLLLGRDLALALL